MKLKEILAMFILTIFTNWFILKMLNMYGSVVKPTEITWLLGLFTGVIIAKLLTELIEYIEHKERIGGK